MNKEQKTTLHQKLLDKIISNDIIQKLTLIFNDNYRSTKLVGGAIVDILEDRIPKDYDIINGYSDKLLEAGFSFKYSTKTADTYHDGNICVQFLKTTLDKFDYKISQSEFDFKNQKLIIDLHSFVNKDLIPVSFEQDRCIDSLQRIPHWKKKGYSINDNTYLSLLQNGLNLKHKIINS